MKTRATDTLPNDKYKNVYISLSRIEVIISNHTFRNHLFRHFPSITIGIISSENSRLIDNGKFDSVYFPDFLHGNFKKARQIVSGTVSASS